MYETAYWDWHLFLLYIAVKLTRHKPWCHTTAVFLTKARNGSRKEDDFYTLWSHLWLRPKINWHYFGFLVLAILSKLQQQQNSFLLASTAYECNTKCIRDSPLLARADSCCKEWFSLQRTHHFGRSVHTGQLFKVKCVKQIRKLEHMSRRHVFKAGF